MDDTQLIQSIKTLIITESEKEDILTPEELIDDEPLFGSKSRLDLDSLDALQISVALKNRFGVRIQGDRAARKHMASVQTIAQFIKNNQ